MLQTEQPDLIVLSVCADGINAGEILEAIARKNFGGKVLVIGQPRLDYGKGRPADWRRIRHCHAALAADAVRRGEPARQRRGKRAAGRAGTEPRRRCRRSPMKAGWLELWYPAEDQLPHAGARAPRRRWSGCGIPPGAWSRRPSSFPTTSDPHFRALSEFVVGRAIEDWRYLLESQGPVDLSINLPVSFFGDAAAVRDLCRAMPAHPAFGGLLIEIDSSEVIDHPDLAVDAARRLRLHNIALRDR